LTVARKLLWHAGAVADLPDGVIARIEVTEAGVMVTLRDGMTGKDFAAMLRLIADAYEDGSARRVL